MKYYFQKNWETTQHPVGENKCVIKVKQDPFDLVPKSWEELEVSDPLMQSFVIDSFTSEDRTAFESLAKLRCLWHEWVKVLGTCKEGKDRYAVCYNKGHDKVVPVGQNSLFEGLLCFKEESHAEKFIECFGELLEKAKILL